MNSEASSQRRRYEHCQVGGFDVRLALHPLLFYHLQDQGILHHSVFDQDIPQVLLLKHFDVSRTRAQAFPKGEKVLYKSEIVEV